MPRTDSEVIEHVRNGGTFGAGEELSPGYRGELMRLMAVFVDSELAGAAGFVPFINSAPGLKERSVAARIVSEKYAHAEKVLRIMAAFGVNPELYVRSHCWWSRLDRDLDLGMRRASSDKRLNVFHYPLEGWMDAVTMNMLMGTASSIQLAELTECSYTPLAEVMGDIADGEKRHAGYGETGLRQALDRAKDRAKAQVYVNYWFPRVAQTFGKHDSQHGGQYIRYGLRQHGSGELLNRWVADVSGKLKALGLETPPIPS